MGVIDSLRSAVTAAGGTPAYFSAIETLRQLVTAYGGTPTQFSIVGLLQEAIAASGGTPTTFDTTSLLRQLITQRGGTPGGFLSDALFGQVPAVSVPTYTAEATTAFAAMTVQPSTARKVQINTLIAGLKADGVWALLDWLSLSAAHDTQAGRVNLKNPAQVATLAGTVSPTFTTDLGFTGNATNLAYIETGVADNAAGNWTQNSASIFAWVNQAPTVVGPSIGQSANLASRINLSASSPAARIHASSGGAAGTTLNNMGLSHASRSSSTLLTIYRNGVSEGTSAVASAATLADTFNVFRSLSVYGDPRVGAFGWGAAMDGTVQLALYNRLNTYLTAIGAN